MDASIHQSGIEQISRNFILIWSSHEAHSVEVFIVHYYLAGRGCMLQKENAVHGNRTA